eukprot:7220769-Alexandrium_andersonii.AAC.1
MMCYDRASEIKFLLDNERLEKSDVKVLKGIHSDVFGLSFRSTEREVRDEARKKRRLSLKRVVPFKHGA